MSDFIDEIETLTSKPPEVCGEQMDEGLLHESARERAKQQPLLQRISKSLTKNSKTYREIIVSEECAETRLAILCNGIMEEFATDSLSQANWVGAIFKGRIQNLEDGLKAAFVIIGQEKNAFLHYWDMLPAANESFEIISHGTQKVKITLDDIPRMYPIGSEVPVQIIKSQIGSKGPRVTTNIALPGRYLVLTPYDDRLGISRKIEKPKERERLKRILEKMVIPEGMGIVIRTAGAEKKIKFFVRDLSILLKKWHGIAQRISSAQEPCMVYQEPGLIGRAVRDFLTDDVDRIVTDSAQLRGEIVEKIAEIAPRMQSKVFLYEEKPPIFEYFHVEKQIQRLFSRRLPLASGGEIVFEETEALTAVDVNTGSHKFAKEANKNLILQVNLEAAQEIARQIYLRNLGGLIIIDFIDMKSASDQRRVYDEMQTLMANDTARFQILPISALGIMQITRQRHSQSFTRRMRTCCPYCNGRGSIQSIPTTAMNIRRAIVRTICQRQRAEDKVEKITIKVLLHSDVLEFLKEHHSEELEELERKNDISLAFAGDKNIHRESFRLLHH
ncbi:MAG: Rne/Rng family ribonuclease [Puniceicoccales bacterium]|jgi:ribonuclease G|nr:Rne/Rng family ribonuclease [Puniceicoccales bacterium]